MLSLSDWEINRSLGRKLEKSPNEFLVVDALTPISIEISLASNYAILNGIALLAISQHPVHSRRVGAPLIAVGATLFSGSIFALLLFREKKGIPCATKLQKA